MRRDELCPRGMQCASPDVLVVGAGPTGLTRACELIRHDFAPGFFVIHGSAKYPNPSSYPAR